MFFCVFIFILALIVISAIYVIPAKAGISAIKIRDSRFRGNDNVLAGITTIK